MQSPLKRVIVYDLETGGLSSKYNSITEIAMVAIDMETLKKVDEISVMLQPRLDCSEMFPEDLKEAKDLYKRLATKDEVTGIKTLMYGNEKITLKNIEPLVEGVKLFRQEMVSRKSYVLNLDEINYYLKSSLKDITKVYIENSYNAGALEATKIPYSLLLEEGIEYEKAFEIVKKFINTHTVGNNKPIISGHNIKKFDNPFMEKFFISNKSDFYKMLSPLIIDTLDWARLNFWELPSFSLGVVGNEMGLTLVNAHRALPDTIANADLLIKMLKNLRSFGTGIKKQQRRKFKLNY